MTITHTTDGKYLGTVLELLKDQSDIIFPDDFLFVIETITTQEGVIVLANKNYIIECEVQDGNNS